MARKSRKNLDSLPVQAVPKTVFHAGAYIRLSVVDKRHRGDSLETQQAIIEAYIAERPDLELADTYIDNGLSGQSFERPAFKRMLADMESGKINCCITKDLSRLGRNAIDTGYYIEKYFPARGVRFIAVTDDVDSADGRNTGVMMNLKNMVNEAYALDVGRKIRATVQMNIRNGGFVGSTAPYGYLKSREDCHKLVPDDYAASIVRRIFDMAAGGQSMNAILEWLNGNGVLPPRRYMHSIGLATEKEIGPHAHWSNQAVSRILGNRIYCGDMVQGRRRMQGQVCKKLPEPEWVVTENTHAAIVSREMFDRVRDLCDKPREKSAEPYYKAPKTENIFSRKVYCSHCGFLMVRKRNGEDYYGFKCNSKQLYSKYACGGMYMPETALRKKLFALLREYEPFSARTAPTVADAAPANVSDAEEISTVRAELDKKRLFFKGLYESLILGDITGSEYTDLKRGYESQIAALTEKEMQLRDSARRREEQESDLAKARQSIQSVRHTEDFTAETIDRLVERIDICKDGRIGVKFSFMDRVQRGGRGK